LLQDQGRGWDHLGVLLSIVYRLVRCFFGLLAMLVWSDLSKDAELTRAPARPKPRRPGTSW
jgi:hypothetical protein